MSLIPRLPAAASGVPRGAEADATAEAAWESIVAAREELNQLILRSRFGISGRDVLASIRRCTKFTAHAEWAVSSLVEEPR